jgi:flagellar biosynthesis/type III secretory pathway ATPase
MDEPIADEVRGILDGHIVLSRALAARGHYPAIDVVQSISRVMSNVVDDDHEASAKKLKRLISGYEEKRDLIVLGAYAKGSDVLVDQAIESRSRVEAFLQQEAAVSVPLSDTLSELHGLATRHG